MMTFPPAPEMILATTGAILLGFLVDRIVGDPHRMPHIVRAIGTLVSALDRRLYRGGTVKALRRRGVVLVIIVLALTSIITLSVLIASYWVSMWLGLGVEAFLCFQCLAATSLRRESMKVHADLVAHDLPLSRTDLSMIVGRDTAGLGESDIARAGVETVAENTSDGVVAPLTAMAVAGGFGALVYKAVNTMDSMLGHKNPRYLDFGRAAAHLDDAANWVPARLTAIVMCVASAIAGEDWRSAWRIWRRDHSRHSSPNSGHPEAACAGALGVRLGGTSFYGGVAADKPVINEEGRAARAADIASANRLMGISSWIVLLVGVGVRLGAWGVVSHAIR